MCLQGFAANLDIVSDDRITRLLMTLMRVRKRRFLILEIEEGEGADPSISMPLISRRDKSRPGIDCAKRADLKLVSTNVAQEITGTIIVAVTMLITRIIAISTNDDIRIRDLFFEGNLPKRTFKVIFYLITFE